MYKIHTQVKYSQKNRKTGYFFVSNFTGAWQHVTIGWGENDFVRSFQCFISQKTENLKYTIILLDFCCFPLHPTEPFTNMWIRNITTPYSSYSHTVPNQRRMSMTRSYPPEIDIFLPCVSTNGKMNDAQSWKKLIDAVQKQITVRTS